MAANFVGTAIFIILGGPTITSWGSKLLLKAWWWFLLPGLCVILLGTALSLINFDIDEIAHPRLQREPELKIIQKKKAVV